MLLEVSITIIIRPINNVSQIQMEILLHHITIQPQILESLFLQQILAHTLRILATVLLVITLISIHIRVFTLQLIHHQATAAMDQTAQLDLFATHKANVHPEIAVQMLFNITMDMVLMIHLNQEDISIKLIILTMLQTT